MTKNTFFHFARILKNSFFSPVEIVPAFQRELATLSATSQNSIKVNKPDSTTFFHQFFCLLSSIYGPILILKFYIRHFPCEQSEKKRKMDFQKITLNMLKSESLS